MSLSNCCPLPVNTVSGTHAEKSFLNSLAAATWPPVKVFFTEPPLGKSTEEVPGLVGNLVALEIEGFGVAVGDLDHAAGHAQGFLLDGLIVQDLVFLFVAAFKCSFGAVELEMSNFHQYSRESKQK